MVTCDPHDGIHHVGVYVDYLLNRYSVCAVCWSGMSEGC